jgi:curli biogenesis system outer membrane secretion channel CsgG
MNTRLVAALALGLTATTTLAGLFSDDATKVVEVSIDALVPHCDKAVASVSVGALTCKASGCTTPPAVTGSLAGLGALLGMAAAANGTPLVDFSNVGVGMGNALTTALKATGCFDIQERESMDALKKEMELAGIKMEAQMADYLITGAITQVAIESSKSSFGAGLIPVVGSISKSSQNAKMAMDLRVIEVKKAKVAASKSFAANSESSSWGISGGGLYMGGGNIGGLFGSHSFSKSPEMDKVSAETVLFATNYLVDTLAKDAVVSRPVPPKKAEEKPQAADAGTATLDSGNIMGL